MGRTRLILVRHGETLANREFRYLGARDDLLSVTGREQADLLAEALAILPVSAVYSSPLQRAYQTAVPIAQSHSLTVQQDADLREGSFGLWEGLSRSEVLARSSEDARLLYAWEHDPVCRPPEGESFAEVQLRVLRLVNALNLRHNGETIVLVSHVGPIKVLLSAALNAPLTTLFQLFLDPATISVVDWHEQKPLVRLFNSHAHLGWARGRWMLP
ncbi:MAG TPA: histidine phosphatase family protein [Ktedonobacteraceae bacterium]